jgi:hypothetical protein
MSQPESRPAWLLLVHQLPPRPTNLRVKTWRRLQALGAVALKHSVYVLPNSDPCREDFEWIKSEIQAMRGEATVFTADSIDTFTNDEVIAAFRQAREADYAALERDADALSAGGHAKRGARPPARQRLARGARQLKERLTALDATAFFPPANRDAAAAAVARVERLAEGAAPVAAGGADRLDPSRFQKRLWVTRPRPGIDRLSSAWLIRRFIDPKARFAFAEAPPASGSAVAFDMYGVEFGHTALGCTFETLVGRFGLASDPVQRIAHIVHDLDLKETRYSAPEAPALAELVDGLRLMHADDAELLEQGIGIFEAFYRAFAAGAEAGTEGRRSRPRGRRSSTASGPP